MWWFKPVSCSRAYPDANAHSVPNGHTHSNSDPDSHSDADTQPDSDAYTDGISYADADPDTGAASVRWSVMWSRTVAGEDTVRRRCHARQPE